MYLFVQLILHYAHMQEMFFMQLQLLKRRRDFLWNMARCVNSLSFGQFLTV